MIPLRAGELTATPGKPWFHKVSHGKVDIVATQRAATQTIPIVFSAAVDPEGIGLVANLNRPGGNVTGMSLHPSEVAAKSVQLLIELVPAATLIGYLVNSSNPSADIYAKEASNAAKALGIEVHVLNASTEHDLDEAFASMAMAGATGLAVPAEPFFDSQRDRIVALAARHALAAIYGLREYVLAGGLMSYGASLPDSYRAQHENCQGTRAGSTR